MTAPASLPVAGVLAPVTTPFDARTGEVAIDRLRANGARLLAEGLDGLVVSGSTGEAALLDPEEHRRLVAGLRDVVPPDRRLVAGTGGESTRQTIAWTRAAAAEGADAVLVRPPGYFGPTLTPTGLLDHFRAVGDASPVPVLVYNIPKYTRVTLDAELLERLSTHPRVIGVKDSSGDLKSLAAYREAAPRWVVLAGSASLLHAALELGCEGGIVAAACFAAPACVALVAAVRARDRARADAVQERLTRLDRVIVGGFGPPGVKAAMDAAGLYGGPVRAPLEPLSPADRRRVAELLRGD